MSKLKKYRRLIVRDGLVCGICKQDISKEVEKLYSMLEWRKATQSEREIRGLKKIARKSINLNLDHIIPVAKGGPTETDNLQVSHRTCNFKKADTLPEHLKYENNNKKGRVDSTPDNLLAR